ncbi:MAG: 2-C-methyl-D-erythritol 4-phosphate cytidylyltransferase [Candidatus Omnitrophica bacterium 4484_213]|nr:MAG: 2-C-methyl-D-erythritol 4-phosphate cytidylyltransferase [Candidatus Omnitrophica bacterium 4484_213]
MDITAIVPAAGEGKRIGGHKPYLLLQDKPILAHTLITLQKFDFLSEIILVVKKTKIDFCRKEVIKKYNLSKVKKIIAGGATRLDSVFKGLREVNNKAKLVFIHDGVRPFLSEEVAAKVVRAAKRYRAAAPAFPCIETIKEIKDNLFVEKTLLRQKIWFVQTPQVFQRALIVKAYEKAKKKGIRAGDDTELVERMGQAVKLVKGNYRNIKITFLEDMILAQGLCRT